jgi:hypothetical protein
VVVVAAVSVVAVEERMSVEPEVVTTAAVEPLVVTGLGLQGLASAMARAAKMAAKTFEEGIVKVGY